MWNHKLKLIMLVFSILSIVGMINCAEPIDIHNDTFREIIEELQNRITVLESTESGENHLIYPQQWATGDGTVSNPWANDCIRSAYNVCPVGGTIYMRAGYYQADAGTSLVAVTKSINIIGEGIGKTILVSANEHGITLNTVDYVTLKGFTMDCDAQTDGVGNYGITTTGGCSYLVFEDLEIKNVGGGYAIDANRVNHSLYKNLYMHDNYGIALHPGCNNTGWNKYNVYRDLYLYDNGGAGIADAGNQVLLDEDLYNVFDSIHAWGNGTPGIYISNQCSGSITNCYSSNNGGVGFALGDIKNFNIDNCIAIGNAYGFYLGENAKDINMNNCFTSFNSQYGIKFWKSDNINVANAIVKNNQSGMVIWDCNDIAFTSCQSYDDREILLQRFAIELINTNMGISLLNCKLSPNKNGEIYNPNDAIIIQWPSDDTDLTQLTADFNALKTEYGALLLRIKAASEAVNE